MRCLEFCVKNGSDAELWIDSIALTGLDSSVFGFKPTPYQYPVRAVDGSGNKGKRSAAVKRANGFLQICYYVSGRKRVSIRMFDIQGRQLTFFDRIQEKGEYGQFLPTPYQGIVILHIRIGESEETLNIPKLR